MIETANVASVFAEFDWWTSKIKLQSLATQSFVMIMFMSLVVMLSQSSSFLFSLSAVSVCTLSSSAVHCLWSLFSLLTALSVSTPVLLASNSAQFFLVIYQKSEQFWLKKVMSGSLAWQHTLSSIQLSYTVSAEHSKTLAKTRKK